MRDAPCGTPSPTARPQMPGFATLAEIEAAERIPLAERGLPASTYEMLARAAALYPERCALRFFPAASAFERSVDLTYRELLGLVHQAANLFSELGIRGDGVVSVILPNLPETHYALWGAEAAGIVNPVNPLLDPGQMADILNAAGTRVLVTLAPLPGADLWEKVESVLDRVPTLETVLRVHPGGGLPATGSAGPGGSGRGPRVLDLREEMAKYPSDALSGGRRIRPDDAAAYFHTGGTTGAPKLAGHTHANQVFDAWSAARALDVQPGQVFFCGLPLFHVNGVLVTGLIPWSRGGCVVLGTPQGYRGAGVLASFWKIVEYYRVNFFSGVPTIYAGLLDVPIGESDVGSLQFALCGAAPMPPEVFREFERRTGVRILEGYGLTEGTCVSSVNPLRGERRVGSIGLRLPYQEMKTVVLDPEGRYQRDCGPGEVGVVALRGPNVFAGYREESQNREAWIDAGDGGRWLNTGDLGRVDAEGYFWLTGRRKELIIRAGHNIDPQLIEGPLHEHPAVALAAAVGRPDSRVGEIPVAYVQLRPGAAASEDDLLRYASERIGERAAVPKRVRVVERIPLTAVGKVFKPELRWREIEEVYREEVAALPGVGDVRVEAGPDPAGGTLVRLRLAGSAAEREDLAERIGRALGRYAIRYELEIDG